MTTQATHTIATLEQLAELYRQPSELVKSKKTERLDEVTATILEASPFFLLATSDAEGRCDVSPRGGPSGQLIVLDDKRVAFPDLNGNNLVDSFRNIIANPHAGLLVLTPGTDETLRIDGTATLSVDPELLDRWDGLIRRPKMAIIVTIDHAFLHCAKAFRRSELWNPESWERYASLPDPMEMLKGHAGIDQETTQLRSFLEETYAEQLADDRPEQAAT
ncbi:MAG: MSMEG_1061 family FMN-dependent PPOX-type flavoprotein [Acidimicrobiales bacterium]